MAIRFHIAKQLLARGWIKTTSKKEAIFEDAHLTLNDDVSLNLEFKHLLARLTSKISPPIMPMTYYINDDNASEVFSQVIYEHYMPNGEYQKDIPGLKWILKPSTLNNGDEIKLFNNIEEIKKHYAKTDRLGGPHVIQQYLPNPALIDGRKFTFRMPVVLTNFAGIFIYKQGYVNISAHPFNLENGFANKKVHITNYVLDGEFANIEQRSTSQIENFDAVFSQMSDIVKKVIQSLLKKEPDYLKSDKLKKFEIFGFDFIMDEKGKVWLLEINQGPDMPTFEENKLDNILWVNFWNDVLEDFVLPIALKTKPKNAYKNFAQILTSNQCAPFWKQWLM